MMGLPIERLTGDDRPRCGTAAHRGQGRPLADYALHRPPDDEYPQGDTAYVCTACLAEFLYRVAPTVEL